MVHRSVLRALILLAAASVCAACDHQSQPPVTKSSRLISGSVSHTDPAKQARLKEALKNAGVPYETVTRNDGEYVQWRGEDDAKVKQISALLFGEPIPEGRSIHFSGETNDRFKHWLKENDIAFETQMSDGREFVIWAAADYPRIVTWEYFPKHYVQRFPPSSNAGGTPKE